MQIADGPMQLTETKKTYTYKINFVCLADNIDEADACFAQETKLQFMKGKPPHLCPLISVEIMCAPQDGHELVTEERKTA